MALAAAVVATRPSHLLLLRARTRAPVLLVASCYTPVSSGPRHPAVNNTCRSSSALYRRTFASHTDNSDKAHAHAVGRITTILRTKIETGQLKEDPEQLDLARRLDTLLLAAVAIMSADANVSDATKLSVDLFSDAPPRTMLDKLRVPKVLWKDVYLRRIITRLTTTTSTNTTPKGLYIHGSVGVGKSFLMDLFYNELLKTNSSSSSSTGTVRRVHFHEFMLDIHQRIHDFKQEHPRNDPIPAVALSLARQARLLCLDEFQVTDIADAIILKRLFSMLWMDTGTGTGTSARSWFNRNSTSSDSIGMIVVATSNRAPQSLYQGGLNRELFLPFIDTLQRHMDVVEMGGSIDYRRRETTAPTTCAGVGDKDKDDDAIQQLYFWPAENTQTRQALDRIFVDSGGGGGGSISSSTSTIVVETDTRIPVRMGRHVKVPRSNDTTAWFDFEDLCNQPLGAADYLSICERYPTLIVDHVPQLNASRFNQARRFVTLVDAVYESKTRLVLASQVPLPELLLHFEATVESHDGDEEIAVEKIHSNMKEKKDSSEQQQMFVKGEGGSSSSAATTMIRTKEGDVEWSATGRIGVSLAQLSAVQDVSFSFKRAESRLVEMNNGAWGRP